VNPAGWEAVNGAYGSIWGLGPGCKVRDPGFEGKGGFNSEPVLADGEEAHTEGPCGQQGVGAAAGGIAWGRRAWAPETIAQ